MTSFEASILQLDSLLSIYSMASTHIDQPPSPPQDLSTSQLTIPSDSEAYSSLSPPSSSPPQSSNNNGERPVIIYQPPTVWSILRGAAINLLLPFINGMMLGFGELLAHEWAFRLGWSQTNVRGFPPSFQSQGANTLQVFPTGRGARSIGPGIEVRDDPMERRRRNESIDPDLRDMASLE